MSKPPTSSIRGKNGGADPDAAATADAAQAAEESREPSLSRPGGFANDPDDPTNPNEVIERHRRKVRP